MKQTADDILQSIEDAQVVDDELAEILEKLAQAFLDAIPKPPDGEEPEESDELDQEMDQAVQDAIQDAMDAIKDQMQQKPDESEEDKLDKDIQDIFDDALGNLGFESDSKNDDDNDDDEEKKDEEVSGPARPSEDGDILYDTVIDGKTPYDEVYDAYYEKVLELLTRGDLTDEQRQIIENYFKLINVNK